MTQTIGVKIGVKFDLNISFDNNRNESPFE
jgi:hypothetical protein